MGSESTLNEHATPEKRGATVGTLAQRSVSIICISTGLLFLLGSIGTAMELVRSAQENPGTSPVESRAGELPGNAAATIAERMRPGADIREMREFRPEPVKPRSTVQVVISLVVALFGAVFGLGGFFLRRRKLGRPLQRAFGALLVGLLVTLPMSLAAPVVWPAVILMAVSLLGLWVLLVTVHPALRTAPA